MNRAGLLLSLVSYSLAQSFPQPSPCFRWSGQIAVANSTLYYYGGEAQTSVGQVNDTWTNALVSLSLAKSWSTGTPPLTLLQPDNGNYASPPAVALGALWPSADGTRLYQYAGEFSDSPSVNPPPESVFAYTIASNSWASVQTGGDTVTRPAEGSTALAIGEGTNGDNMAYYFSGHLDTHTVQNWSDQIARVYLSSLITYDLGSQTMKNVTHYSTDGSSSNTSTPETNIVYRADGTLTYVPGMGTGGKGLLVAIGGATSTQYIDNSVLDVFDIGSGGWTKQATLGDTIGTRVNHCAVLASAQVNGQTTSQIFIYGGQQLNQSNRDSAIYILTLPSFTWTFVSNSLPSQPVGRAGHQCALVGSQLVVMGGLVASDLLCDSPGIYVYDTTKSSWTTTFTPATTYTPPAIIGNLTKPASSSSSSNAGAIAGGVVGGIILLLVLLLSVYFLRKRKKDAEENAKIPLGSTPPLTTPDSARGFSSDKMSIGASANRNSGFFSNESAFGGDVGPDDDIEERLSGMTAAFGSQLVPRQALRVTNPENAGVE